MVKLSIVMPVYNSSPTLDRCLSSVFNSDFKDFELILVDDASTDNSLEIAKKYPCKIVSLEENKGPAYARNIGIKKSKSDIIFFLDADTQIENNSLDILYESFKKNKNILGVLGVSNINSLGKSLASNYNSLKANFSFMTSKPITGNFFSTDFGALKKKIFKKIGYFDERYKGADIEDIELGYRLPENCILINKRLIIKHKYPNYFDILKKYFSRSIMFAHYLKKKKKKEKSERKLSKTHSNLKNFLITLLVLFNFLMLFLSLFNIIFIYLFLITLFLFFVMNYKLWLFVLKKKKKFIFLAPFYEYTFSLAIGFGGIIGSLK